MSRDQFSSSTWERRVRVLSNNSQQNFFKFKQLSDLKQKFAEQRNLVVSRLFVLLSTSPVTASPIVDGYLMELIFSFSFSSVVKYMEKLIFHSYCEYSPFNNLMGGGCRFNFDLNSLPTLLPQSLAALFLVLSSLPPYPSCVICYLLLKEIL